MKCHKYFIDAINSYIYKRDQSDNAFNNFSFLHYSLRTHDFFDFVDDFFKENGEKIKRNYEDNDLSSLIAFNNVFMKDLKEKFNYEE